MGSQAINQVDLSVALVPTDLKAAPGLLVDLNSVADAIFKPARQRHEALAKAKALVRSLETPRETMIQQLWAQDYGRPRRRPEKVSGLAAEMGFEEELLRRIMRHVASMGYLKECGPDLYALANFTKSLSHPYMGNGYPIVQFACNTTFLKANPPHGVHFNDHMVGYLQGRPGLGNPNFYPVQQRLIDGFDASSKDAAMFVHIAGGVGHYTDAFRAAFPDVPGRLVLQDLPLVISQIRELRPRIERMGHDFLEEQPIKGERAYYMHFVLHDWPDETCIRIVNRLKAAMRPGYSRLLVHEHVIPETGADSEATALNLIMTTCFSSKGPHGGGLIAKIWTAINGVESIVECERVD
ncbi:hypothetical protein PG994_015065 [Apiospora phragmitis]|uniref:O-methyltransferase C-terminal domain-containing protein n=1 Tax=Apiospora phragmitis TaxID=2905665 RepID=A0ABR1SXM2_9PEZI